MFQDYYGACKWELLSYFFLFEETNRRRCRYVPFVVLTVGKIICDMTYDYISIDLQLYSIRQTIIRHIADDLFNTAS